MATTGEAVCLVILITGLGGSGKSDQIALCMSYLHRMGAGPADRNISARYQPIAMLPGRVTHWQKARLARYKP